MTLRALVSKRLVSGEEIRPGAVLVQGEKIHAVVAASEIPPGATVEDFGTSAILPGLFDSHVHLNEPGRTEWEGFETGTCAASAGGYTTLIDMPLNCLPATTSVAGLEAKREAAKNKARVDWAAWGGLVGNNQDQIEPLASAGVRGFKCFLVDPGIDSFSMVTEPELRSILPALARTGLPLLVHAELAGPIEREAARLAHADWTGYDVYLESRPHEAELCAIRMLLSLCREYGFRLHVVHLSTAHALELFEKARGEGLPVSVETCPHYLYFAAETIPNRATLHKCAPPIRPQENRERLWQGLRRRSIDLVATDHSPCPPALKKLDRGDFKLAWGGIASLSVALPAMWTEASRRGFTMSDLVRWMAEGPAHLAGLSSRKGHIRAGNDADFVVFEPEADFVVTEERLYQRHRLSPYLGERLRGIVRRTYLRGACVFSDGEFPGTPRGKEVRQ